MCNSFVDPFQQENGADLNDDDVYPLIEVGVSVPRTKFILE